MTDTRLKGLDRIFSAIAIALCILELAYQFGGRRLLEIPPAPRLIMLFVVILSFMIVWWCRYHLQNQPGSPGEAPEKRRLENVKMLCSVGMFAAYTGMAAGSYGTLPALFNSISGLVGLACLPGYMWAHFRLRKQGEAS